MFKFLHVAVAAAAMMLSAPMASALIYDGEMTPDEIVEAVNSATANDDELQGVITQSRINDVARDSWSSSDFPVGALLLVDPNGMEEYAPLLAVLESSTANEFARAAPETNSVPGTNASDARAVPLPTTLIMLLTGIGALGALGFARRRKASAT